MKTFMLLYNEFVATVRDESHQITKRRIAARSLESAVFQLKKHKYRVLAIEPRKNPFLESLKKGKIELGSACNKRDLASFSGNLALMGLVRSELENAQTPIFQPVVW